MAPRWSAPEYVSREVQQEMDEACFAVHKTRLDVESFIPPLVLREQAQEHERKARECREKLRNAFNGEPAEPAAGGEFVPPECPAEPAVDLSNRDVLAQAASLGRLELLRKADALIPGVELAESIGAQDSLEKMLAHQIAAGHAMVMRYMNRATVKINQINDWTPALKSQSQTDEAVRLGLAAARLMQACALGVDALHKWRGMGGQQRIDVHKHVHHHEHKGFSPGDDARVIDGRDRFRGEGQKNGK